MNNKTDIDVKYVSPLKKICMTIGELPASYLETMSYYEMLIWFVEFLKNQVIPTVNNNAEAVQELQSLYEELRQYVNNYFDNLDVQEEINNKLDEYLEDGTLQRLIDNFIGFNSLKVYDTVADLKLDENLVENNVVKTLGYHTINDDGGAIYKIREKEENEIADESFTLALFDENLIAELQYGSVINVKQLGAYGDNQHGDSSIIQKAFNLSTISQIYFPKGIYIAGNLTMPYAVDLLGEESTLTYTSSDPILDITIDGEYRNHFIKNLRFLNNGSGNGLEINTTSSFITSKIENCMFRSNSGWGLKTNEYFSHSLIQLCTFALNGLYLECGDANQVDKCLFFGIGTGIYLKCPTFGELNNTISNNTIVNQGYAIHVERGDNVLIINNQIEYGGEHVSSNNPNCSLFIDGQFQTCHNVNVVYNNFGGTSRLTNSIVIYSGKHCNIANNRFTSCTGDDIKVLNYYGGSNYNVIERNNIVYSTATNPKEDKWQPVEVYTDSPNSISGVWLPLTLNNTETTAYYMRDENNMIYIRLGQITFSESTSVIGNLPTGYRPASTILVNGSKSGAAQTYSISWNGDITVTGDIVGATNLTINPFMADMLSANID